MHVFADLRPYICTFANCEMELAQFPTRAEWAEHEFSKHRITCSWGCPECAERCGSETEWTQHLDLYHQRTFSGPKGQIAKEMALTTRVKAIEDEECPLCRVVLGKPRREFVKHVGRHMEEIALMALPQDDDEKCEVHSTDTDGASSPPLVPTVHELGIKIMGPDMVQQQSEEPQKQRLSNRSGTDRRLIYTCSRCQTGSTTCEVALPACVPCEKDGAECSNTCTIFSSPTQYLFHGNVTACSRCQDTKTQCDLRFLACMPCERAGMSAKCSIANYPYTLRLPSPCSSTKGEFLEVQDKEKSSKAMISSEQQENSVEENDKPAFNENTSSKLKSDERNENPILPSAKTEISQQNYQYLMRMKTQDYQHLQENKLLDMKRKEFAESELLKDIPFPDLEPFEHPWTPAYVPLPRVPNFNLSEREVNEDGNLLKSLATQNPVLAKPEIPHAQLILDDADTVYELLDQRPCVRRDQTDCELSIASQPTQSEREVESSNTCDRCGWRSKSRPRDMRTNMKRHMDTVCARRNRFSCPHPECLGMFPRSDYLRAHMKEHHERLK